MSAFQQHNNTTNASKAFKDFYHYFFEDLYLVGRGEVSVLDFYPKMKAAEKQQAIKLLQESLQNSVPTDQFAVESLGLLKAVSSIPFLKKQLEKEKNYYFRLIIAKALYRINKDAVYFELLEKLPHLKDAYNKKTFAHWLLDVGDERTVRTLYILLNDKDDDVKDVALRLLNHIDNNFDFRYPLKTPKKGMDYFIQNEHASFIAELTAKLKASKKKEGV